MLGGEHARVSQRLLVRVVDELGVLKRAREAEDCGLDAIVGGIVLIELEQRLVLARRVGRRLRSDELVDLGSRDVILTPDF